MENTLNINLLVSLLVLFAGFIIGLGAVTVIDLLGFLGRKSGYWTEATIRSHKVTKVLIWIGIALVIIGLSILYSVVGVPAFLTVQIISIILMILNGIFLSFYISPALLKQEAEGNSTKLLSSKMQQQIIVAFIISFVSWWGNLFAILYFLIGKLSI